MEGGQTAGMQVRQSLAERLKLDNFEGDVDRSRSGSRRSVCWSTRLWLEQVLGDGAVPLRGIHLSHSVPQRPNVLGRTWNWAEEGSWGLDEEDRVVLQSGWSVASGGNDFQENIGHSFLGEWAV